MEAFNTSQEIAVLGTTLFLVLCSRLLAHAMFSSMDSEGV